MPDSEKVIESLEMCERDGCGFNCTRCHYETDTKRSCIENLMHDALELLKKKQPKKGTWEVKIRHHPYPDGREYKKFCCSVCGNDVDDHEDSDFCPWCGADMRKDGERD